MTQFIHIPKTGGTTVFRLCNAGDCEWKHHSHHAVLDTEPVAFTIRDPMQRIISAIHHLKHYSRNKSSEFRTILNNAANLSEVLPALDMIVDETTHYRAHQFMLPMTNWLGTLAEYKAHEHLVEAAIETSAIGKYFNTAIHARNHADYDLEFDATPTAEFIAWFESKYAEDVELYNYIRQQPYYVAGGQ